MPTNFSARILVAFALLLACVSAYIAFCDGLRVSEDLHNILLSAQAFWDGENPYRMYLAYEQGQAPRPVYDPNYLPPMYMLVGPLLWLDFTIVRIGMALLNLGLGAGMMILLQRLYLPQFQKWQTLLLVCALFTSTPFRSLVLHGQTTLVGLVTLLAALALLRDGKRTASLVALFIALMKYTVTAPLALVFARKGRWRIALIAGFGHIALICFAAYWLRTDPLSIFRDSLAANSHAMNLGFMNYSNIFLVFGPEGGRMGIMISAALLLLTAFVGLARKHDDDLLCLTLYTVVSTLCLYHTGYDMVMYAVPAVWALSVWRDRQTASRFAKVIAGLLGIVTILVWWVIEAVEDWFLPQWSTIAHGKAVFDGAHVVELWYVLMVAATASMACLFVAVWRKSLWRWRD